MKVIKSEGEPQSEAFTESGGQIVHTDYVGYLEPVAGEADSGVVFGRAKA